MTDAVEFQLYVAGDAPNSLHAIANLKSFCDQHLPGRHSIALIDVFKEPSAALRDMVLLTPTLVVLKPAPVRRIVGDLREPTILLQILGLDGGGE